MPALRTVRVPSSQRVPTSDPESSAEMLSAPQIRAKITGHPVSGCAALLAPDGVRQTMSQPLPVGGPCRGVICTEGEILH